MMMIIIIITIITLFVPSLYNKPGGQTVIKTLFNLAVIYLSVYL